jgi:tetratricopeptide (TPR) repeat protein
VRNEIARPLAELAIVFLGAVAAFAQSAEVSVWKGELHSDSRQFFEGYTVALSDNRTHDRAAADVRSDGSFEFRHVNSGDYQLVVSDGRGQVLYQSFVTVSSNAGGLDIRLPEEKTERPPSGAVSASQLLHPPDRKAIRYVTEAQKMSQAGQYAKAAAEIEKAIAISPDYADAHINLGAQYLRMGRYQEALEESERALRIGPPSAILLSNLAFAQEQLEQNTEAIQSARWSLRLDPDYLPAHYILGMALATSGQSIPEAISHLEKAAEVYPTARVNLDRLRAYWAAKK